MHSPKTDTWIPGNYLQLIFDSLTNNTVNTAVLLGLLRSMIDINAGYLC